jgi:predicted nucleic acid-binding protein
VNRVAFDTNILAYIAGVERHPDDAAKIGAARALLQRLTDRAALVAPVQVLGELFVVLTRAGANREEAREIVLRMADAFAAAETTRSAFLSALDLASLHKLQLWDALILNAAAEAGCSLLLSEDMATGFAWRGAVVVNPFAAPPDERLVRLTA